MRARTGKIARLPREVRDELNRRLDSGEEGAPLLAWLNGHPATLKVMQDRFAGQPVSKQNLSEWRQGGWRDWQRQQEAVMAAGQLLEDAADLEELATDGPLTDRVAEMIAVSLAQQLREIMQRPDGPEKTRAMVDTARELIRLRRTDREREEAGREQEEWRWKREEREQSERAKADDARKQRLLAPLRAAEYRSSLVEAYGGGPEAVRRAWWVTGVQFDLPRSEWVPPAQPPEIVRNEKAVVVSVVASAHGSESGPVDAKDGVVSPTVKPGQSQSDLVQAGGYEPSVKTTDDRAGAQSLRGFFDRLHAEELNDGAGPQA